LPERISRYAMPEYVSSLVESVGEAMKEMAEEEADALDEYYTCLFYPPEHCRTKQFTRNRFTAPSTLLQFSFYTSLCLIGNIARWPLIAGLYLKPKPAIIPKGVLYGWRT